MKTPAERKPMLSGGRFELGSGKSVSPGQAVVSKKKRNSTAGRARQARNSDRTAADQAAGKLVLRLFHFQYKYPGIPISTMAVPQNASVGRVMMVFNVQAEPMNT